MRANEQRATAAAGDRPAAHSVLAGSTAPAGAPALARQPFAGEPGDGGADADGALSPVGTGTPTPSARGSGAAGHPESTAQRRAPKEYKITRAALDDLYHRYRDNFVRFGSMRLAAHVTAEEADGRLTLGDGVIDLRPRTPLDRYVAERAARAERPNFTERRDESDGANGKAEQVALIRALEDARAHAVADDLGGKVLPPSAEDTY